MCSTLSRTPRCMWRRSDQVIYWQGARYPLTGCLRSPELHITLAMNCLLHESCEVVKLNNMWSEFRIMWSSILAHTHNVISVKIGRLLEISENKLSGCHAHLEWTGGLKSWLRISEIIASPHHTGKWSYSNHSQVINKNHLGAFFGTPCTYRDSDIANEYQILLLRILRIVCTFSLSLNNKRIQLQIRGMATFW